MGVVHKLNKETIDFIVQSKQDNPKLSCRDLSNILLEKYNLVISKSSVSSILKNKHLSSSVGRPSRKKNEKEKFSIPQEKKRILFEQISKNILLKNQVQESVQKQGEISIEKENPLILQKPDLEKRLDLNNRFVLDKITALDNQIEFKEGFTVNSSLKRERFENIKNCGLIFLDAAQMEVGTEKILSNVFNVQSNEDSIIFNSILYYKLASNLSLLSTDSDYLKVLGKDVRRNVLTNFANWFNSHIVGSESIFEYIASIYQAFFTFNAFEISVENKSFYLDSFFTSVWDNKEMPLIDLPVNIGWEQTSQIFQRDKNEFILEYFPYKDVNIKQAIEFFFSLSNPGQKVSLINNKEESLACTFCPEVDNAFIVGLFPDNPYFQDILSTFLSNREIKVETVAIKNKIDDKAIYYWQTTASLHDKKLDLVINKVRIILIKEEKTADIAVALLSNNLIDRAEILIDKYFNKFGKTCLKSQMRNNLKPIDNKYLKEIAIENQHNFRFAKDVLDNYLKILEKYILFNYFEMQEVVTSAILINIYKMNGNIVLGTKHCTIELFYDEKIKISKEKFVCYLDNINKRAIKDIDQRQIFCKLL